ncbi:MAG: T9SS type A sorting domain-containing protein [Chitinophagales bacterium]
MKRTLILAAVFVFCSLLNTVRCYGQKEANTWFFGNFAGIDFNSGTPEAIADGAMSAFEGCAAISDKTTGEILIYTNGINVWNANHQVMANGTGLTADPSSAQAAVVVPDPGNSDNYYIFTAGEFFSGGSDGYRYSIVDISLNGGLGAVTAVKNELLYGPACEKLTVVKNSAGTGYWIATHEFTGNNFVCFELTASGISAPVVSAVGTSYSSYNPIGCMKLSPDGTRLATVLSGLDEAEVYDFNATTGELSNAVNLGVVTNNVPYVYGIAFSPNGKILYVDEENNTGLFQFNLDAGTTADIIASKTVVGTTTTSALQTMQLGPDGRLYICRSGASYLAVVNDPDVAGTGCNFVNEGFYTGSFNCTYGLPGFIENVFNNNVPEIAVGASTTTLCQKFCVDYFDMSTNNPVSWQWEFEGGIPSTSNEEDPDNICYVTDGIYNVKLITTSANGSDTLLLEDYITVFATPPLPVISFDGTVLTSTPADAYQWQLNSADIPGATNQSYTVTQSGSYTVLVFDLNGCKNSTSFLVTLTGLETLAAVQGIIVYPNPSGGIFNIQSTLPVAGNRSIRITNTIGQVVYYREFNGNSPIDEMVNLSNEPVSVFLLQINSEGQSLTRKLVVTH